MQHKLLSEIILLFINTQVTAYDSGRIKTNVVHNLCFLSYCRSLSYDAHPAFLLHQNIRPISRPQSDPILRFVVEVWVLLRSADGPKYFGGVSRKTGWAS